MHDYLRLFGTNNKQNIDRFLIYEKDLMSESDMKETQGGIT